MVKNILVTGACGFTGSHMVETLEKEGGFNITATDIEGSKRSKYYEESDKRPTPVYFEDFYENKENVSFINADITNKDSLKQVFEKSKEFDAVFHTASLFDYFANWKELEKVNLNGVENVLDLCLEYNSSHFIHWSTLGVLGDSGFDSPKTEKSDYNPHNDYCLSKKLQEQKVKKCENLDTTIIRPAPIYGKRHKYGIFHIINLLIKLKLVPIFKIKPRDKKLMFPSVHVNDLTNAALFVCMKSENTKNETYNVLSDNITQEDLLKYLSSKLNTRSIEIPINIRIYKKLANGVVPIANIVQKAYEKRGKRPFIDAPMTYYLSHNMWFSNKKIKKEGYNFKYEDPKRGLDNYIDWLNDESLI